MEDVFAQRHPRTPYVHVEHRELEKAEIVSPEMPFCNPIISYRSYFINIPVLIDM